jgi:hypothetical protein
MIQWERLSWPLPDAIVPLPDAREFARIFASWLNCLCAPLFSSWNGKWEWKRKGIDEGACLLILGRRDSREKLDSVWDALSGAFPKKIYILTLLRKEL